MNKYSEKSLILIDLINKHFNKDNIKLENNKEEIIKNKKNDTFNYSKFDDVIINEEKLKENNENNEEELLNHGCSKDHRKEIEIYEKSEKDKLRIAEEFKENGNNSFLKNDLNKASFFYQKGLIYLNYTIPKNEEEQKKFDELTIKLNSNLSLIELKNKNYTNSLDYIYQVLKLESNHYKSLFRKSQIYYEWDKFEKCKESLNIFLNHYPNNKEGKELENNWKIKIKNFKNKEKKLLKNYF